MLWVINSLIYGFFTAIYTLFNQHYKINGYILGIWRGFGISLLFLPFIVFFPIPTNLSYWLLLIFQGILIGIYDSHLFFSSAQYGAGPTSRFMAITVLITTFLWWLITPKNFYILFSQGNLFITLILILLGFTFCYWKMIKLEVSRQLAKFIMPAIFALSGMSIITKYIALNGSSIWQSIIYYLVVSTFISGCYNLYCFLKTEKNTNNLYSIIFAKQQRKIAILLVLFSTVLIIAKTIALRLAPNPGYVTALLLISPIFIFIMNFHNKVPDNISLRAGFSMLFFLILLVLLVNGNYGIND